MVADLRYFNSLEHEVDTLKSQLETQKTQFLNEIDRLSREYYYVDHMNAILSVFTDLDEVTNLQCDYLETVEKCEHLEKELSTSRTMSKSFEALQKHAINLELDLQQTSVKKKIKNDKSFKKKQSRRHFLKESEQTRQPMAVPISTREPKQNVNQSVQHPTIRKRCNRLPCQESRNIRMKLYEQLVFNKRTTMIVETIHVNIDELPQMESDHLELLYSPMFSELLNGTSPVVSKSSAVHAADNPDKHQQHNTTHNSTTTDVADPPPLNIHSTHQTPTQVQSVTAPENINQAETNTENAQFDDDEFINIFSTPVQEQGETSTRRQLETDGEMCMFALTVSRTEPKNIKEAMADSAWIESMQEELHQFDRLDLKDMLKRKELISKRSIAPVARWKL
ncbi:hypothetical protein Tco_0232702 [Tanacetum coccineum]